MTAVWVTAGRTGCSKLRPLEAPARERPRQVGMPSLCCPVSGDRDAERALPGTHRCQVPLSQEGSGQSLAPRAAGDRSRPVGVRLTLFPEGPQGRLCSLVPGLTDQSSQREAGWLRTREDTQPGPASSWASGPGSCAVAPSGQVCPSCPGLQPHGGRSECCPLYRRADSCIHKRQASDTWRHGVPLGTQPQQKAHFLD